MERCRNRGYHIGPPLFVEDSGQAANRNENLPRGTARYFPLLHKGVVSLLVFSRQPSEVGKPDFHLGLEPHPVLVAVFSFESANLGGRRGMGRPPQASPFFYVQVLSWAV